MNTTYHKIRSASGGFTSDDVMACSSIEELRSLRFIVSEDICAITAQIARYSKTPKSEDWPTRASSCLHLQQALLAQVDRRLFELGWADYQGPDGASVAAIHRLAILMAESHPKVISEWAKNHPGLTEEERQLVNVFLA